MIAIMLRRLAGLFLTLAAVSLLIFVVMDVLPGDPASITLGTSASPDTLAALREEMGLNQPVLLRYLHWLAGVAHGDFGRSYTYGVPVADLIAERLTVTLPLALMAILLSVAIALPLGASAAARRGGAIDNFATFFAQTSIAVPAFWTGLLLILLFSTRLGILPSGGFPGWSSAPWSALTALLMPAVSLAIPQAGVMTRVVRAAVLETRQQPYARTALAKGLSARRILWQHCVPNALVPMLAILGLQFTFLVAGSVLVENVFNLPGLGRLAYQALSQRDIVVMQDVVLVFAGLVIIVNFLVDLSYLAVDPRLRSESA
ncbi:ABC transporter permease [Oryzifoliimicrobium ureilyticus]|uniref:ABC transporter permease n=1 Tax=Oryzifoliimicrobium ureilyticus TaxID=3113724 RepID=UPI00307629F0